jgi:hypothetical protein
MIASLFYAKGPAKFDKSEQKLQDLVPAPLSIIFLGPNLKKLPIKAGL